MQEPGPQQDELLLITGGSGLVGSGLARALGGVILTRKADGHAMVRGDLRERNLGMAPQDAEWLRSHVTGIIHCAADLRFTLTLEAARAVNTEGTRRLLDFAESCPYLRKFAHVSTLYVAGRRAGAVPERPLPHECGYFNVYEQSKHEAEALVIERMRRLPVSIYRLSSIIGDARNGRVQQINYFHGLVRMVPWSEKIRTIPADPLASVDLIADDWCTAAMAELFAHHFVPGSIHHLCAGAEHSLHAAELFELVFQVYNAERGTAFVPPRLSPDADARADRPLPESLSTFLPHLTVRQPFERGHTGRLLDACGLTLPPARLLVERVVRATLAR